MYFLYHFFLKVLTVIPEPDCYIWNGIRLKCWVFTIVFTALNLITIRVLHLQFDLQPSCCLQVHSASKSTPIRFHGMWEIIMHCCTRSRETDRIRNSYTKATVSLLVASHFTLGDSKYGDWNQIKNKNWTWVKNLSIWVVFICPNCFYISNIFCFI